MKPKLLLRIAAITMLLHTIGHTLGALTWDQAPNKTIAAVIEGMKSNYFEFAGRQVTLGMFFQGYGVEMIFVLLFIVVILWLSGSYIEEKMTRKLLPCMIVFLVLFAIAECIYFFPAPAIMTLLAAALAGTAYFTSRARRLSDPLKQ